VTRPLAPRPTDAERADERRFVARLVAATVAVQLLTAIAVGLTLARGPRAVGGAAPRPALPVETGATNVRSH
jgi:hypothetical protein